jgi:hypothetical protein
MPRKRRLTGFVRYEGDDQDKPQLTGLSHYEVGDQDRKTDRDNVRRLLVGFAELGSLPARVLQRLIEDLLVATYRARGGINARKRHRSNKAWGRHVYMADIGRAMKRARLPVKNWQHHDEGFGESFYYQVAHALATAFKIRLPRDLGPPAKSAAKIRYGKMSPAMMAAQLEELVALWRQRLGDLAVRLEATQAAELTARRRRLWGDHLVDVPRSCEELASAYLSFPF